MTRSELVSAVAYGVAFANRMERHGTPTAHEEPGDVRTLVVGKVDARPDAHRHASVVAEAAAEWCER